MGWGQQHRHLNRAGQEVGEGRVGEGGGGVREESSPAPMCALPRQLAQASPSRGKVRERLRHVSLLSDHRGERTAGGCRLDGDVVFPPQAWGAAVCASHSPGSWPLLSPCAPRGQTLAGRRWGMREPTSVSLRPARCPGADVAAVARSPPLQGWAVHFTCEFMYF